MTEKIPNVLLIMTDQHRADMMTCAGRQEVTTPNIDRIAARGVRFTNAYCPYPVCLASRSSLLTGLYPHNTGAINNKDLLDWRYRTVANHFADSGYLTGLIGKMHFNDAHKHGFEYYLSINDWLMYLGPKAQLYANEIANHPLSTHFFNTLLDDGAGFPDVSDLWDGPSPWVGQVKRHDFNSMASQLEAKDHLDAFIARETVKFMTRYRDQPFFMVASFMKPHSPFYPPKPYADLYPVERMELPQIGDIGQYSESTQKKIRRFEQLDPKLRKAHQAGYRGSLAFVDQCVGEVYDALEELALLENTIVVYTSDHGEMDGDHGMYQKFSMFEPSVKVPLIVSYPKVLPENKVTEALTEYIGLYPTLAELTRTEIKQGTWKAGSSQATGMTDVGSFADILRNPDSPGPDAVFCEHNLRSANPNYMIRTQRYKYVYNQGDSVHELYDLQSDPGELTNLIGITEMKPVIEQLQSQLFAWYHPYQNQYNRG
jgi:choline-sulfatase